MKPDLTWKIVFSIVGVYNILDARIRLKGGRRSMYHQRCVFLKKEKRNPYITQISQDYDLWIFIVN